MYMYVVKSGVISFYLIKSRPVPMSGIKVSIATWLCILCPIVDAHWWPHPKIPSQFQVAASTSEPTGCSSNPSDAAIGGAIPGGDLRSQGDAIIRDFEKELVQMRTEIAIEAEDLMLSICEAALERKRAELRDRHRSVKSVDDDEEDVF